MEYGRLAIVLEGVGWNKKGMEELKEEKKKKGLGKGCWICVIILTVVVLVLPLYAAAVTSGKIGHIQAFLMGIAVDLGII